MRHQATLIRSVLFAGALLHLVSTLQAGERLVMKVVPTVALMPATVRIRTEVAPDAANRELELVADSPDFYRSSEVPLDGERAPRVAVLELRDLPAGEYRVTATLTTASGQRTVVKQLVKIVTGFGE